MGERVASPLVGGSDCNGGDRVRIVINVGQCNRKMLLVRFDGRPDRDQKRELSRTKTAQEDHILL